MQNPGNMHLQTQKTQMGLLEQKQSDYHLQCLPVMFSSSELPPPEANTEEEKVISEILHKGSSKTALASLSKDEADSFFKE